MTKIKTTALALSAIVLFANNSFAAVKNSNTDSAAVVTAPAEPLNVEYLGEDGDYRVFKVTVTPATNQAATFSVTDFTEGEMYSAKFSKEKVQTLKIERRLDQNLDFTVSVGGKTFSKSFTIMPTVVLK
ncbi:MAG: hypothetical protein QM791_22575 [Ferruginibacter sp.]